MKQVRAVDRAVDVLMFLSAARRAVAISELERGLRLSRPTLYRLLQTLTDRELVRAEGDDAHVADTRARYDARRAALAPALEAAGLRVDHSEAGLYLWATVADERDGAEAAFGAPMQKQDQQSRRLRRYAGDLQRVLHCDLESILQR